MCQGALCAWSVAAAHASDIRARLCVGDCCIAVREAATQSRPVTSTSVTPRRHERLLRGGGSVQSIGGPSGLVCTAASTVNSSASIAIESTAMTWTSIFSRPRHPRGG